MKKVSTKKLAATAVLAAVSAVLAMFSFKVPLMPSFISVDFSDLPALVASFSMGPVSGAAVIVVKNIIDMFSTKTAFVGELCNILMGVLFVVPAGLIYRRKKTRAGALLAGAVGAVVMALGSLPINYYITFPAYGAAFKLTPDKILAMYQSILPSIKGLWQALFVFNLPFTFIKGIIITAMTFLVYKPLSRVINR